MKESEIIDAYDHHIRLLIAFVQAFINHHNHPDFIGLPDIDLAMRAWESANDFNLKVFDRLSEE